MGLFDFFKNGTNKQFVSEPSFEQNVIKQIEMTPLTMKELRKIDVAEERELKLEYFFYTNSLQKANSLAQELRKLDYQVEVRLSASSKKLFLVTGWTTQMGMEDEIVASWTKKMCEVGYDFDCEFDGWGTTPDQSY